MSSSAKRQVIQRLHDMGFSDADIRSAVTECGYNVEACADWIVSHKQDKKPRLFVGMEVWVFSTEDNDWCPGNVVAITKQLISIIFNGHDFRWLEKESDLYRIQDEKPAALNNANGNGSTAAFAGNKPANARYSNNNTGNGGGGGGGGDDNDEEAIDDPYAGDMQQEYTPPRQDETDYYVTFTESVLGLELYSDEDGFNCIVGRCVSTIARQKVTPGSQIVQVNDRWLANYRFEEIRDAVKQAARQPPLAVTFRIKKNLLRRKNPPQQGNGISSAANAFAANGYDQSQSATSPDTQNPHFVDDKAGGLKPPKSTQANGGSLNVSLDDEKRSTPHDMNDDEADFLGTLPFDQCEKLQTGDHIDHRDDVGRFLLATIVDKDQYKVKIHYEGWNSKWDTWCDYKNETHRFAAPRSISRKPNTRFRDLKIRDYVDINPIQRHRGWRVGQIRRMDKYSGQAQIVYKEDGQEFLYWAHLNNPEEIAPFMTRAAEQIAIQQQQKLTETQEASPDVVPMVNKQQRHSNSSNQQENPHSVESEPAEQFDANNMNNNPLANLAKKQQDEMISTQPPLAQQQAPPHHVNGNNASNGNLQNRGYNNSYMSPPGPPATVDTNASIGYNSNVATVNSYNPSAHQSLSSINQQSVPSPQPPPANNAMMMANNPGGSNPNMMHNHNKRISNGNNMNMNMNMNGMNNVNMMNNVNAQNNNGSQNGSNLHLYNQIQPALINNSNNNNNNNNGNNAVPANSGSEHGQHQKSRSRVFPTTIKNKKLPPKPAAKKRSKGINRSKTQPLPDNQNPNHVNNGMMNGNMNNGMMMNNANNGYNNNNYAYHNNNNANMNVNSNGYAGNNINMNNGGAFNNGYNNGYNGGYNQDAPMTTFNDLSFNVPQHQQQQAPHHHGHGHQSSMPSNANNANNTGQFTSTFGSGQYQTTILLPPNPYQT